jgi:hypothetical protein
VALVPLNRAARGRGGPTPEIVPVTTADSIALACLQATFLASVLSKVLSHGRVYFRHLKSVERKEEYIAEMVALAWAWHRRLAERGKDAAQFPTTIATFAARAVRSGRNPLLARSSTVSRGEHGRAKSGRHRLAGLG